MPLKTKTYNIEDTISRLEDEMKDSAETTAKYELNTLAEELANTDSQAEARDLISKGLVDNQFMNEVTTEGQQLERYITGLYWHQAEYDADEIVLGALDTGERDQMRNIATDPEARKNTYIALGTIEAPFVEHDPGDWNLSNLKKSIKNVSGLHPGLSDWMQEEITDLSGMSDEMGNSFKELVMDSRQQEISRQTNG